MSSITVQQLMYIYTGESHDRLLTPSQLPFDDHHPHSASVETSFIIIKAPAPTIPQTPIMVKGSNGDTCSWFIYK